VGDWVVSGQWSVLSSLTFLHVSKPSYIWNYNTRI